MLLHFTHSCLKMAANSIWNNGIDQTLDQRVQKSEYVRNLKSEFRSQNSELKKDDIIFILNSDSRLLNSRFTQSDGYGRKDDQDVRQAKPGVSCRVRVPVG